MNQTFTILITALMTLLLVCQFFLAKKQLKNKEPDGKILLIITSIVAVLWVPLSVFRFILEENVPIKVVWYVIAAAYMIFTVWYTNNYSKRWKN